MKYEIRGLAATILKVQALFVLSLEWETTQKLALEDLLTTLMQARRAVTALTMQRSKRFCFFKFEDGWKKSGEMKIDQSCCDLLPGMSVFKKKDTLVVLLPTTCGDSKKGTQLLCFYWFSRKNGKIAHKQKYHFKATPVQLLH